LLVLSETSTIPKGTLIVLLPLAFHTDKDLWGEDVKEFKPERFLEENIKKVHPYSYFPLSNGQRICPGMKYAQLSMKMFISKFLMKYRVTTELKYDELDFEMRITTTLKQGYMMKVERR
jgi:cytochrome P450